MSEDDQLREALAAIENASEKLRDQPQQQADDLAGYSAEEQIAQIWKAIGGAKLSVSEPWGNRPIPLKT